MSGDLYRSGEFVWVAEWVGERFSYRENRLGLFLEAKEGNIATVLMCFTSDHVTERDVSLEDISPATTANLKKKQLREAIALLSECFMKSIAKKLNSD